MVVLSYLVLKRIFIIYVVSYRCKNLASNHTTMNLMSITPLQPFLVSQASVSYSFGKKLIPCFLFRLCVICGHHYELLLHYRGIFIRPCVLCCFWFDSRRIRSFTVIKNPSQKFLQWLQCNHEWAHFLLDQEPLTKRSKTNYLFAEINPVMPVLNNPPQRRDTSDQEFFELKTV